MGSHRLPQLVAWCLAVPSVGRAAAASVAAASAAAAEGDETCTAGGLCNGAAVQTPQDRLLGDEAGDRGHFWPRPRGRWGQPSVSPYVGPWNLTKSLAWTWHHPEGRFATVINGGPLIDEKKNIYLTSIEALRKFSPDGDVLWTFNAPQNFANTASINGDSAYIIDVSGLVLAVHLETGMERWRAKAAPVGGQDISAVEAYRGVLVASADRQGPALFGGASRVVAMNASTGEVLWRFRPDSQLWNFMPMFTANGTVVFQDQVGGVYHLALADGSLIWRSGYRAGWEDTWTDGGTILGPNDIVYAVSAKQPIGELHPNTPGDLRAYRLEDGALLWSRNFSHPPNCWPIVGRLREGAGLSLVMPVGAQGGLPKRLSILLLGAAQAFQGLLIAVVLGSCIGLWNRRRGRCTCHKCCCGTCLMALLGIALAYVSATFQVSNIDIHFQAEVWALDAETGAVQWRWDPPPWIRHDSMGDAEGLYERLVQHRVQPVCIPNPFASPTLDANGTIYIGYMNGKIYAIRDTNADGEVHADEVDELDAGAAFSHPGVAMAPGMLVISSCDTLFVFKN